MTLTGKAGHEGNVISIDGISSRGLLVEDDYRVALFKPIRMSDTRLIGSCHAAEGRMSGRHSRELRKVVGRGQHVVGLENQVKLHSTSNNVSFPKNASSADTRAASYHVAIFGSKVYISSRIS